MKGAEWCYCSKYATSPLEVPTATHARWGLNRILTAASTAVMTRASWCLHGFSRIYRV